MADGLSPAGGAISAFTQNFLQGYALTAGLSRQRRQDELELRDIFKLPPEQQIEAIRTVGKNLPISEEYKGALGVRAAQQQLAGTQLSQVFGDPQATVEGKLAAIVQARQTGMDVPGDLDALLLAQEKARVNAKQQETLSFLRDLHEIKAIGNKPAQAAAKEDWLVRLEQLKVPKENTNIIRKMDPVDFGYMVTGIHRAVVDGHMQPETMLAILRNGTAGPRAIWNMITAGEQATAMQPPEQLVTGLAPAGGAEPSVVPPAPGVPEIQPQSRPGFQAPSAMPAPAVTAPAGTTTPRAGAPTGIDVRLSDIASEVETLRRQRAEARVTGDQAEVRLLTDKIAEATKRQRDLEDEQRATVLANAPRPIRSLAERQTGIQREIDRLQQTQEDLRLQGTEASGKKVAAIDTRISNLQGQLKEETGIPAVLANEDFQRAYTEVTRTMMNAPPITDKAAVTQLFQDPAFTTQFYQRVDALRTIEQARKVSRERSVEENLRRVIVGQPTGIKRLDQLGPQKAQALLGIVARESVAEVLRKRVSGLTTGVKEIDALSAKQAEDILVKLNRADPLKAAISEMLRGGEGEQAPTVEGLKSPTR